MDPHEVLQGVSVQIVGLGISVCKWKNAIRFVRVSVYRI